MDRSAPESLVAFSTAHRHAVGVEWPDFLTVVEAASVLRIGRTAAYDLAARYLRTGGTDGLPVVRMGRVLRVPRARLEELAGGPLTPPTTPRLETSLAPATTEPAVTVDGQLSFPSTAA
jgi:hypothetical protein